MKGPAPLPARALPMTSTFSVPLLLHRLHGRFRIDEAVAVELAVAISDQVVELTAEPIATFELAEEPRAARHEPARRNQHATAEEVGRVATRGAAGPEHVRLIAIDAERQRIAAAERSRQERQIELLPLAREAWRIRRKRERGLDVERAQAFGIADDERLAGRGSRRRAFVEHDGTRVGGVGASPVERQ